METCTDWRKWPTETSWNSTIQCKVLHWREGLPGKEEPHAAIKAISRWREVNIPFYSALLSRYCIQLWGPKCKKDIDQLQWNWTCSASRREVFLGGPNNNQYLWRDYWEDGARIFTTVYGRRIRDNGHKWQQQRFRLDKRKKTFSPWGVSSSGTGCPEKLCSL